MPLDQDIRANPYRAGRSMTMSRRGIVASSHTLASQAGLDMLRSGGNAMDASVAAAATLAVVEPMSTGLGGDVWLLYYEAGAGEVHALNGSGRSPMGLGADYFRSRNATSVQADSWEAVTVPGAVDAWETALRRFGTKPLAEVLAPAIRYAEEGFAVAETIARHWKENEESLAADTWCRDTYLLNGKAPPMAGVFRSPNLAKSLRRVAEGGRDAFYRGPIAEEIVRHARESGGFLTMKDFEAHRSDWVKPISTTYRGREVLQCPPNGQGLGVLIMLNILEGFDLGSMERHSAAYLHLLIEAKKLAYGDLGRFVADPDRSDLPVEALLSKQYGDERRGLIDPGRASADVGPGAPSGADTVYLTAIDEQGNAASFINSLYESFGSKIVGGDTGILLQNRGAGFSLEPGHLNTYAPGKRPFHTIIPGMVLAQGRLYLSYGLMGGDMQPQGHVQFLLNHLDFGLTIQEAIDTPRWRHTEGLEVLLEEGTPPETAGNLEKLGHRIVMAGGEEFGGAQAIAVDPSTGTYLGASDPRKDGAALSY